MLPSLVLLYLHITLVFSQGPCQDYIDINMYQGKRTATYQIQSADYPINDEDNIIEGNWYRFQLNGVNHYLIESCVEIFHCGTSATIWLNGQHPAVTDGVVNRQACMNQGHSGDCCSQTINIDIRQCEDPSGIFYVYKLRKPADLGDHAYCTTTDEPVVVEQENKCPPMHGDPTLEGPQVSMDAKTVQFICVINYNGENTGEERFQVRWLFGEGDNPDHLDMNTDANNLSVTLHEQYLSGHMGKTLRCSVRSYFASTPSETCNREWFSSSYFMGIILDPSSVYIYEGQPDQSSSNTVKIKSTIPVVCPNIEFPCNIRARIFSDNTAVTHRCEISIAREDWNPEEKLAYNENNILTVVAPNSPPLQGFKKFLVEFEEMRGSQISLTPNNIWKNYRVDNLEVNYQDHPYRTCSSTGDPHITTFDKKYYHVYDVGQFILSKSTVREFEVHVRHYLCRADVNIACNCAVAVRELNTVIGLSVCGSTHGGTPRVITFTNQLPLPKGFSITKNQAATRYSLNLSSGTYIVVTLFGDRKGINIYLYTNQLDRGTLTGLCGNNNGDKTDDLKPQGSTTVLVLPDGAVPREFSNSYKLPREQSLFDGPPVQIDPTVPETYHNYQDVCVCGDNKELLCGDQNPPTMGAADPTTPIPDQPRLNNQIKQNAVPNERKRRDLKVSTQTDDDVDIASEPFNYGENFQHASNLKWPTPSGITEEQAKEKCQDVLETNLAYTDCTAQFSSIDTTSLVEECVTDVQIMDSMDITKELGESFEQACIYNLMRDPMMYKADENGQFKLIPQWTKSLMCPQQCNSHGSCVDGVCQCSAGFEGPDCSQNVSELPHIMMVEKDGLCDVSQGRRCAKVTLEVKGIIASPNLRCKVIHTMSGQIEFTTAVLKSVSEVQCSLPSHNVGEGKPNYSFILQITRDGATYSNSAHLTVYDAYCITCTPGKDLNTKANCIQEGSACYINGECYYNKEFNPNNGCEMCDVSSSSSSWTTIQDNKAPQLQVEHSISKLPNEELILQLQASDPDDQPLTFILTPALSGISLTTDGELTVSAAAVAGDMRITVADGCGKSDTTTVHLSIIDCPCPQGCSCQHEDGKPKGQGHYTCQPPSGFANCDTDIPKECTNPTLPVEPNLHGHWCPWNTWSHACTKQCDFGYRVRSRRCLRQPCEGNPKEFKLCNERNCQMARDETDHLVRIEIEGAAMVKVVSKEEEILGKIEAEVEQECMKTPTKCCTPLSLNNAVIGPNVKVAKGYPQLHMENVILSIFAFWDTQEYSTMCGQPKYNRGRNDTVTYMDPKLLMEIILQNKQEIEKTTGITIASVTIGPGDVPFQLPLWLIIIIAVICLIVLILFIICATCIIKKSHSHRVPEEHHNNGLDNPVYHGPGQVTNPSTRNPAYGTGGQDINPSKSIAADRVSEEHHNNGIDNPAYHPGQVTNPSTRNPAYGTGGQDINPSKSNEADSGNEYNEIEDKGKNYEHLEKRESKHEYTCHKPT